MEGDHEKPDQPEAQPEVELQLTIHYNGTRCWLSSNIPGHDTPVLYQMLGMAHEVILMARVGEVLPQLLSKLQQPMIVVPETPLPPMGLHGAGLHRLK